MPRFSDDEMAFLNAEKKEMESHLGKKMTMPKFIHDKLMSIILSSEALELEARKLAVLEQNQKLTSRVLEILTKTTTNINTIARNLSRERLEAPETWKLKESQWNGLLGAMRKFGDMYFFYLSKLCEEIQKLKILKPIRI